MFSWTIGSKKVVFIIQIAAAGLSTMKLLIAGSTHCQQKKTNVQKRTHIQTLNKLLLQLHISWPRLSHFFLGCVLALFSFCYFYLFIFFCDRLIFFSPWSLWFIAFINNVQIFVGFPSSFKTTTLNHYTKNLSSKYFTEPWICVYVCMYVCLSVCVVCTCLHGNMHNNEFLPCSKV